MRQDISAPELSLGLKPKQKPRRKRVYAPAGASGAPAPNTLDRRELLQSGEGLAVHLASLGRQLGREIDQARDRMAQLEMIILRQREELDVLRADRAQLIENLTIARANKKKGTAARG